MKILVVDDTFESRYMLEAFLKTRGHEVTAVTNGEEAMEKLQVRPFDLVISDILMPIMDGFELCRSVRKDVRFRNVAFIFYTATYTSRKDETFALKIGADRFVRKPCELNELERTIEEVVAAAAQREAPGTETLTSEEEARKLYSERLVRKLELSKIQLEAEVRARKEAEEEARAAAESWHVTFDAILDPVVILETNGQVRRCNQAFAELVGLNAEAVVGRKCFQLVHGSDGHIEGCPLLRSLQSGEREVMPMSVGEEDFLVVTDPIKGPDSRITGVVHVIRDVTELKQAEERLRESEETYRNLFQNAQVGLFRTRISDGKILESNEQLARMFGYDTREEFIANYATGGNYVDPGTRERMLDEIRRNGFVKNFEARFYRKDRSIFWARYTARIYPDKGWIEGVAEDVTEIKAAEEEKEKLQAQLLQAQKIESVGRLAGGVAHDFNNMLGVILGYGEHLLAHFQEGDPLRKDVERILEAAKRSANLTRQLLAFARKQVISPRVLDLNDTVEGTLKMLRRLIGEDIDLVWLPGHGLWNVNMDPTQLDQILVNLAVNARDAIAGVGRVTITTQNRVLDEAFCAGHPGAAPGEYVMLSVEDNGCGMGPETLSHLFEPFFTTKEVGHGTGMGLPTVYGIVQQNNGLIDVHSELGKGTVVAVYLPKVESKAPDEERPVTDELPTGKGETVLLVEDEPVLLEMGKAMLERFGYRVVTADTPHQAIRIAQEEGMEIHLLMTDVILPQMNGRELANRLREIRPGLPCLFMSGYTSDIVAKRGIVEKGVHFIQKPFTLDALARKVRKALSPTPSSPSPPGSA